MERSDCGLLEVSTKHTFHKLMRYITGYPCDMVGFCYAPSLNLSSSPSHYNVILYDSYTGRLATRSTTDLSSLKSDATTEKVVVKQLSNVNNHKLKMTIAALVIERGTPIGDKLERENIKKVLKY